MANNSSSNPSSSSGVTPVSSGQPSYNGVSYGYTNPAAVGPACTAKAQTLGESASQFTNIHCLDRLCTWSINLLTPHLNYELYAVRKLLENPVSIAHIEMYDSKIRKGTYKDIQQVVTSYTETPGTATNYNFSSGEYTIHTHFLKTTANSAFIDTGHYEITSRLLRLNGNETHVTTDIWQQASRNIVVRAEEQYITTTSTNIKYTENQVESFSANNRDLTGDRFIYSDQLFIQVGSRNITEEEEEDEVQGDLYHKKNTVLTDSYGNFSLKVKRNLNKRINNDYTLSVKNEILQVAGGAIRIGTTGTIGLSADGINHIKGSVIVLDAPIIELCGVLVPCSSGGEPVPEKGPNYQCGQAWKHVVQMQEYIGSYKKVPKTENSGSIVDSISNDPYQLATTGSSGIKAPNYYEAVTWGFANEQINTIQTNPDPSDAPYA